ncbi:PIN domain-like protein [Cutaneotrichosporon oleaginosum]|uniref:PIN domain-like protein n=1 Tax=Cutaneotrichosporon oleaginosum TaxID=879819 RepID=A0A0J1AYQ3_9TREE|nr:PIN domain-like protein [Cutaneotrichosporon oleaginosum]KLT40444.1 PIN domain-like protein [Cutaneotrichosporon oleaginosum]TXT15363.1 hypothetical protein COLE_01556 [Cutaneotrichosporon oleaginosum]
MGVPGLWDLLRPAAVRTSLNALSRDAFLSNANGLRALTIGIDASIWIFHARTNHHGANAYLRTLFFKIAALLQHPVLPVFVFDGPKKPAMKRGQRVTRNFGVNDGYSRQFKDLLDVCGLEWWNAPGEAEAELAIMNRQGKIDAVLSDDVDALLFGAKCLLRNNSPTLSGAQAPVTQSSSSRTDMRHYEMYRLSDIVAEWTRVPSALQNEDDCRRAMVLIALLSGGDYVPEGVGRVGPKVSFALAKAGYADFLKLYAKERPQFDRKVAQVHEEMLEELATNRSGHIGRRMRKLAEDLAGVNLIDLFPLECYLNPATSPLDDPEQGWPGFGKGDKSSARGKARSAGRGDLEGMARACERYFEWGTRDIVCKKFAGDSVNLFGAEIVAEARSIARSSTPVAPARSTCRPGQSPERITSYFSQSTIATSQRQKGAPASSARHLVKIHSTRPSPMCSGLTEYRLEYQPQCYMDRCRAAMDGSRADPSTLSPEERVSLGMVEEAAAPINTSVKDEVRIWFAGYLIRAAWPHLIEDYEEAEAAKAARKAAPKKTKAVARNGRKTATTSTGDANASILPSIERAERGPILSPHPPTIVAAPCRSDSIITTGVAEQAWALCALATAVVSGLFLARLQSLSLSNIDNVDSSALGSEETERSASAIASNAGLSSRPNLPIVGLLDSMIVARARKSQPVNKAAVIPESRAPKAPYFVLYEDDDGFEHIDLTQVRPK